ncbi:hypothetical protein C8J57DRAFT_1290623 [Mycena rebaudengoi]|nr:hypothetical protein C8J57DRAFT_1290623 [Mycena rebaudengoi]
MSLRRSHTPAPLSSLAEWSERNIRDVFQAPSDDLSRTAIAATFSDKLVGSLNGAPLNFEGISQLVMTMRHNAPGGLQVEWKQASDMPDDSLNRDGSLLGAYVIRGIHKLIPGSNRLAEFERRKRVSVRIESQSFESGLDSRKIVNLNLDATDVLVDKA